MPMINYKALKKLKAITVLTLATFGSDALEFNHKAFQDEISKIYTIDSSLQTLNAKSVLDELFDIKDIRIREALNTICENEVGSTMIKLFYQNKEKMSRKLRITTSTFQYIDRKGNLIQAPSAFDGNFTIHTARQSVAIRSVGYYFDDVKLKKKESLDSVLFHELGHAFHLIMGRYQTENYKTIEYFYKTTEHEIAKRLWTNDEELQNITGYYHDGTNILFDPLNCNMYDLCKQCQSKKFRFQISLRVFHLTYKTFKNETKRYSTVDLVSYELKKFLLKLNKFILDRDTKTCEPETGWVPK